MDFKCEVCDKSFSGEVPFRQHEVSAKHIKKMQLFQKTATIPASGEESTIQTGSLQDSISCSVCLMNFSNIQEFTRHAITLEHALKIQKRNDESSARSNSTDFNAELETTLDPRQRESQGTPPDSTIRNALQYFAECRVCQKQFTGPEPYQQHLSSLGHKKKTAFQNNIQCDEKSNIDDSASNGSVSLDAEYQASPLLPKSGSSFSHCDICQKHFTGREPYQQHLVSAGHKKKMSLRSMSAGNGSQSSHNLENSTTALQSNPECFLCQIKFVDYDSYQSHIDGDDHKFRIEAAGMTGAIKWKCEMCDILCTGPIPFGDHMRSQVHLKKERLCGIYKNLSGKYSISETDSKVNEEKQNLYPDNAINWCCNLCDVQCSGAVPYNQHIKSHSHLNNQMAVELQTYFVKNSKPEAERGCSEPISNFNETSIHSRNDTLLVPGAFSNIQVVSPENLNITVFEADEEIVFDDKKKLNEAVLPDLNIDNSPDSSYEENM